MDIPGSADDVLGQPSRARLFSELSELRRPAGTEEMAASLGLHPNGVRLHLERMLEAGLVVRERTRQAIGRPRDMWSIAPGARPGGEPPSAYADLGRWLAQIMSGGKTSMRAVEEAGRDIGRGLVSDGSVGSPEEQMFGALASLGFQPDRRVDRGEALTYTLCNCPYREVARGNQQVVCTLHRGVTRGLLDEIAPATKLAAFEPRDPDSAGCVIELTGELAQQAVAGQAATASTDSST